MFSNGGRVDWFERFAMTLHNQSHQQWHAFILEPPGVESVKKLTEELNRCHGCMILKNRLSYLPIEDSEEGLIAGIRQAINEIPRSSMYALLPMTIRLDQYALEQVAKLGMADHDGVVLELMHGVLPVLDQSRAPVGISPGPQFHFVKRTILHERLTNDVPIVECWPEGWLGFRPRYKEGDRIARAGLTPLGRIWE